MRNSPASFHWSSTQFKPSSLYSASKHLSAFFLAFLLVILGGQVLAIDYVFTGTGDWTDVAQWDASNYPGTNILAGHTITIQGDCSMDPNVTSSSPITIDAGGSLSQTTGNLTMNETLTNNGAISSGAFRNLVINSGGAFIHDGTSATLNSINNNNGAVTVNAGKSLTVGTYTHNGTLTPNGAIVINGTLTVSSGQTLTISDTWLTSNGSISVSGTLIMDGSFSIGIFKSLTNNGSVTVNAGKTLTLNAGGYTHNGSLTPNGSLLNNGTVAVSSGQTLTISDTWFTNNFGNISVTGTLVVDGNIPINSGRTLTNNGTVTVNAGKTLTVNGTFNNNGTFNYNGNLNGTGTISGTASFTNPSGSTVAPGSSPGCLTFNNDFTTAGTLEIELADGTACTNFDQLIVNGDATIGGIINITFPSGEPSTSTFAILTATGAKTDNSPTINWPVGYSGSGAFVGNEYQVTFSSLPVELVYFRAAATDDRAVELDWRTASELNNEGFTVERKSQEKSNWEEIGFVAGHGTTLVEQSYSFIDQRPNEGMNYYRLKQMDFDGKFDYSEIRSVNLRNLDESGSMQVFPNPIENGMLNIHFNKILDEAATASLFAPNGQLLLKMNINSTDSQIDVSKLPAGLYWLEVTIGQEVLREKIIKQ